ncbi:MAG: uracil-DNA glycosylase [Candidatus Marinimicrobia bacterium]|nr:uracil-DNA glycosylase [Candidatus Neomarinimicrobiota bacterium]MCF7829923.1 uracil-DNA glycosylase [Candidatus Neomarinimicrobiota bacterium]MCF7879114.1 uracil-DNA glycosylase [Candidatus Neomarinimicrobiota bacterium]
MTFRNSIDAFIESLHRHPEPAVFNPWYQTDPSNDIDGGGSIIRRRQLRQYFLEREDSVKYLLIAEALGYQGGHFSGMAMTSERILLGHKSSDGVQPEQVFRNLEPERTSKPSVKANGFSENTATTVWTTLAEFGIDTYEIVLWNTFPWHPFEPDSGMLTNRTPTRDELEYAQPYLEDFLALFPECTIVALGNHSSDNLTSLGIEHTKLRHPSFGGAPKFRAGLEQIVH